jgi:hypothetical protein
VEYTAFNLDDVADEWWTATRIFCNKSWEKEFQSLGSASRGLSWNVSSLGLLGRPSLKSLLT